MDEATAARLQPRDRSSFATQNALVALQAERVRCDYRVAAARQDRADALLRGSNGGVDHAEKALRDAERDVERLNVMQPALEAKLEAARELEAGQATALGAGTKRAQRALAAYVAAVPEYAAAAAKIAEIARLDHEADQAIRAAQQMAREAHLPFPSFEARPSVSLGPRHGAALSAVVVLPHMDGTPGLLWGKLAAEHRPQSVYANPNTTPSPY